MTAASKVVLYASYVSPYPTNSGERIRAVNLIKALRSLGYGVEAIVGNYERIDLKSYDQDRITFHEIPFSWPRLRQATHVYWRPDQAFLRQVHALHRSRPLSAILLDYGFMGAQIAPLQKLGIPVILGTHNLESALTAQARKTSITGALAIGARRAIEGAHERWFFPKADALICVSEHDRVAYQKFVASDRVHVVPNFLDIGDDYAEMPRSDRVIMTGSFGNFQNVEGLRWFVRNVWDESLWRRATLCVAGQLSERAVREFADVPGLTALGARDDLVAEIARSACAVVPVWQGGGTRLKSLEAMAARTPVVTTLKGCEGIAHGGAFWVADTAATFRSAILEILTNRDKAAKAAALGRTVFDRDYGVSANVARLERVLESTALAARSRRGNGAATEWKRDRSRLQESVP